MIAFISVAIAVCFSVTGELLLKAGMNDVGVLSLHNFFSVVGRMMTHPKILIGFGSIGVGAVFWLAALSRADLSWAYPMLSLGYILVLLFSSIFLHESVGLTRWIGVLIIVVGVILVSRS